MKVRRTRRGPVESSARSTQAVTVADHAHLRAALESVHWERHGVLQTLRRLPLPVAASEPAPAERKAAA